MFIPLSWLKNSHLQTITASLLNRMSFLKKQWEVIELPDGDFLELCWEEESYKYVKRPIALVLHGLEGSVYSPYVTRVMTKLKESGYRPVTVHFRGCGRTLNRLDRNYHSGDTADLDFVVSELRRRYKGVPLFGVGYSMGANVLLKWLGEKGSLDAAVAVSTPFELAASANRIDEGFSKFYQWILIDSLQSKLKKKFQGRKCPIDLKKLEKVTNFWEFDDLVTAPLNGFKDVHEYYKLSSSRQFLCKITTPTLLIQAKDDPFLYPAFIPQKKHLSDSITVETSERGGHVGFVSDLKCSWLQDRVVDFFSKNSQRSKSSVS